MLKQVCPQAARALSPGIAVLVVVGTNDDVDLEAGEVVAPMVENSPRSPTAFVDAATEPIMAESTK